MKSNRTTSKRSSSRLNKTSCVTYKCANRISIRTGECRQSWYRSSNISHGVPFLLYTTCTCNHSHCTGACCHRYQKNHSVETKKIHCDSNR